MKGQLGYTSIAIGMVIILSFMIIFVTVMNYDVRTAVNVQVEQREDFLESHLLLYQIQGYADNYQRITEISSSTSSRDEIREQLRTNIQEVMDKRKGSAYSTEIEFPKDENFELKTDSTPALVQTELASPRQEKLQLSVGIG